MGGARSGNVGGKKAVKWGLKGVKKRAVSLDRIQIKYNFVYLN